MLETHLSFIQADEICVPVSFLVQFLQIDVGLTKENDKCFSSIFWVFFNCNIIFKITNKLKVNNNIKFNNNFKNYITVKKILNISRPTNLIINL